MIFAVIIKDLNEKCFRMIKYGFKRNENLLESQLKCIWY